VEEGGSRGGFILHMWAGPMVLDPHKQDISKEFPVYTIAIGKDGFRSKSEAKSALDPFFANNSYARRKLLRITLQADEGVTISSVASAFETESDEQTATVFIRKIIGGQQKTFIVNLTVPQGKEKLVTIGGTYGGKELVGMDVVVLRPSRKCTPDEVVIHPKLATELLWAGLKEGMLKLGRKHRTNEDLRLLLDWMIKYSHEAQAASEEILSAFEDEAAQIMKQGGFSNLLSWLNCRQLQCPLEQRDLTIRKIM
jgi:hypothetical protein